MTTIKWNQGRLTGRDAIYISKSQGEKLSQCDVMEGMNNLLATMLWDEIKETYILLDEAKELIMSTPLIKLTEWFTELNRQVKEDSDKQLYEQLFNIDKETK